jgi:hypothetical protein
MDLLDGTHAKVYIHKEYSWVVMFELHIGFLYKR